MKKLVLRYDSNGARIGDGVRITRVKTINEETGEQTFEIMTADEKYSSVSPHIIEEAEPVDPDPVDPDPDPVDPDPVEPEDPGIPNFMNPDFIVSNAGELYSALSQAKMNAYIQLNDGNYGDITINDGIADFVNLYADNRHKAVINKLVVNGTSNLGLTFVRVTGRATFRNTQRIRITFNRFESWFEVLGGYKVTVLANEATQSLYFDSVNELYCQKNVVDNPGGFEGDRIILAGPNKNGVIEENYLGDLNPRYYDNGSYTHSDHIQFHDKGTGQWPESILVRRNIIRDNPANNGALYVQGINVGGKNIVVEENLVETNSPNSIVVANIPGGTCAVRKNYVLPASNGAGGKIRVYDTAPNVTVEDNVCVGIEKIKGVSIIERDNVTYAASDVGNLFANTGADDWTHFVPKGAAVGTGAAAYIAELQGA